MFKIFEKIVKNRLKNYLENNSILSPQHYGFQQLKSTEDAIDRFRSLVYTVIDNKKPSMGVTGSSVRYGQSPAFVKKME